ncbi:MAG TPA: UDP-N-acetylmuramoyl-L-alanyl-D-glutamate--2,6-diaminopimelate ligase [Thermoanaerobaculia bacterium]|nr:UDP-N-acetylmuramoyl-L-alanyl-D-glutamate--2,6-diaminopimelate ligase [Thermoanaerobaculia bacterium]
MKLRDVLRDVPVRAAQADLDSEIAAVTADSRLVVPGALFVAIPGTQQDGAKFIGSARAKGATAIVGEASDANIHVDDPRRALAIIAANFYGRPADKLSLVGVTGTSGKTTTTKMIESIFDAAHEPVGMIGTIEYRAGDERLVADRTTPDAVMLHQWFAKMVDAGVRRAVMEVSSHALALERTYGIRFAAAVFTNLSQDHLDFHKDFEEYFAAKRLLFEQIDRTKKTAIVNIDDAWGRRLADEMGDAAITFGRGDDAGVRPADTFDVSVRGLHGRVLTPRGEVRVESRLLGMPNLYNWLGAIGAAIAVGIGARAIEEGIRSLQVVRGRFEYVGAPSPDAPAVIVDYAHKPDALEKLLAAVRDLAPESRLWVVFGCGGDRDKGKRPKMGEIAARMADRIVVTSDNPRGEEPKTIIEQIVAGIAGADVETIESRRDAIAHAIDTAAPTDVVVIAGKGHETYQVLGDRVVHFDDREEAELALKKRHEKVAL